MSIRVDWQQGIEMRFPLIPGFCSFRCGKPLPKGRWRYCSDKCGYAAYVAHNIARGNPGTIRAALRRRDHGICSRCKKDTEAESKEWFDNHRKGIHVIPCPRHSWEAHHKIAVAEGGGVTPTRDMKLDDFETLCLDCHKKETKALRYRLRNNRKTDHLKLAGLE